MKTHRLVAVDLFCGVGGLSFGLKEAGVDVRASVDVDSSCKYPYEHNCKATYTNVYGRMVWDKPAVNYIKGDGQL